MQIETHPDLDGKAPERPREFPAALAAEGTPDSAANNAAPPSEENRTAISASPLSARGRYC